MKQLLDGYIDLILQTVSNCRGGRRDGRRGEGRVERKGPEREGREGIHWCKGTLVFNTRPAKVIHVA